MVIFCTAQDEIERLLGPHIVSQAANYRKYCSVMLAFRPDMPALPRLSLRYMYMQIYLYMYMYMYICICIYVYVYIYYIYIHVYMYMYTYVYINPLCFRRHDARTPALITAV